MALFECKQFQDEQFHWYFVRFQDYMDGLGAQGLHIDIGSFCMGIIEGMNHETLELAEYMSNGRILCMEPMECWDFLCYMGRQCLLVGSSSSILQPDEASDVSRAPELDTQMHVEEQFPTHELGKDGDFDVPCDATHLEETIDEPCGVYIAKEEVTELNEPIAFLPIANSSEEPSLQHNEKSGDFSEFILIESDTSGKSFDSFHTYFEKPPLDSHWFEHMPSYENWAHRFDKLKRCLTDMLFKSNLFLCYLCFFKMSSQVFDRLLRALTMSEPVKLFSRQAKDVK